MCYVIPILHWYPVASCLAYNTSPPSGLLVKHKEEEQATVEVCLICREIELQSEYYGTVVVGSHPFTPHAR